ncbi:fibronectin type III domain-containing protein [Allohahella sp. A8]|uniref:fibronectin type III domain-containing protein n=1 Tax=Allohahella sp. A8 TaxID=3141461 RepID=UPI003A80AE4C
MSIIRFGDGQFRQLEANVPVEVTDSSVVTAVTYAGVAIPFTTSGTKHIVLSQIHGNLTSGTYNLVVTENGVDATAAVPYVRTHAITAPTGSYDPTSLWAQIRTATAAYFKVAPLPVGNSWVSPHTAWTTANALLPVANVVSGPNKKLSAEVLNANGSVVGSSYDTAYVPQSTVTDLVASTLSSTQIKLSWTAAAGFTYNPRYRVVGDVTWTTLPAVSRVEAGPLTATATGLTPAEDYEFDLTASEASSNAATATTAPASGIVDLPGGGFGGGATFNLPLYIDHTVITGVTYKGSAVTHSAVQGTLTVTIPSGIGIGTYDLVIVTQSQSFTYPVVYVQLTPFVASAKLTTVAADGRYPGLPFRVRAIQASAQVAITDLAVTTTDTTATLTFTPIAGATQYLYQRAVGTTWGGDTYASTATGTFQFTGLSTGTTYSFRIFADGVVSNIVVKATTGTGGTAPTGNTGTGTETTPGVALASQLTSVGTPGRIASAIEPQWDIHMTAERLAVGTKATGSSLDSFFFADETYVSDAFKVKGTRSFQCNYIHSRAYDSMGGNPGNNEHQGYLHWGGGKHFPSNKYVYGGGFIHVQFSVYVEPSYLWQTNATYQKIFRIGGRRNATTQDNSGWLTLVVKPDSSTDSMKVLVDNEINFNAMTEAGKSNAYVAVYPAEQVSTGSDRLIKGQWNTFEFAVYPEPNGTKAIFKLWKYNPSTQLMERIYTNTNRTDFLVTKSGYYTSLYMLNVWNWNRYTRVGTTGGNFAQSGGTWIQTAPGAGTHNLASNAVVSDQRMYFDEIKIHTSHADMNEFDNLGEKVIGWAR